MENVTHVRLSWVHRSLQCPSPLKFSLLVVHMLVMLLNIVSNLTPCHDVCNDLSLRCLSVFFFFSLSRSREIHRQMSRTGNYLGHFKLLAISKISVQFELCEPGGGWGQFWQAVDRR